MWKVALLIYGVSYPRNTFYCTFKRTFNTSLLHETMETPLLYYSLFTYIYYLTFQGRILSVKKLNVLRYVFPIGCKCVITELRVKSVGYYYRPIYPRITCKHH